MAKPKTTPRPVPSDDSKVVGTSASNVTPIRGRARRQVTDDKSVGAEATDNTGELGAADVAPAVVVFGKDDSGKAHASRFGEVDAELAVKAAGLMGYSVLRVTSPDIASKALEAPVGRIFASGKGFVPFCKMPLYEALSGFEGAFAPPPPPEPQPEPPLAVTGPAASWDAIDVGNLVLAAVDGDEQWWPSLVTEARGEGIFVLRWVGYPSEPPFARRRDALGLLPPAPVAAEAAGE